jgi:cytochrome c553
MNFFSAVRTGSLLTLALMSSLVVASESSEVEAGRKIYLEGVLPSGKLLSGLRFSTTPVSGAAAACVNCHRPSGMGSVEGDTQVAPIASNYLFHTGEDKPVATMDPRVSKRFNQAHDAYTDAALAQAIRGGTNNQGLEMHGLMPRYTLSDKEMKSVIAYLKQLNTTWSTGVTGDSIRLATVITPDVDPERRKAYKEILSLIFKRKNGSTINAKHSNGKRLHMVSAAEMVLGTERNWTLDIWELKGAPETWAAQLDALYQAHPVFALVSGLSNGGWEPVHDFCERQQVPEWFPTVPFPVQKPGKYSLYFSRGVVLEADVLARHLSRMDKKPKQIVQVYRDDEAGRGAAAEFKRAMADQHIAVENLILPESNNTVESLRVLMNGVSVKDSTVMFWLGLDDVAALQEIAPPAGISAYFSGILTSSEPEVFAPAWKGVLHLVYPYELPDLRELNLQYFHTWLNINKMDMVDEAMQSEVFFSLNYLTDTLSEMLNNLYRDYLLERGESMINKREGAKVEQEVRDLRSMGLKTELIRKHGNMTVEEGSRLPVGQTGVTKREGTTIYPRLSLGPGQRFASKGGYIVHYVNDKIEPETSWIVP